MEALESSASNFKLTCSRHTKVTFKALLFLMFLMTSAAASASEISTENGSDQSSGVSNDLKKLIDVEESGQLSADAEETGYSQNLNGSEMSLSREKRKTDRLTAYACEDSRLNISCGDGLYMDIIRANYGRFSITICNDHGNTEWQVDCQSARTLRAMQARCSNKNRCDVPVDSSIFGDPCPGTFKYIEVHYACKREKTKVTSTTARPRPHWFPPEPRPPSDWSSLSNHLNNVTSPEGGNKTGNNRNSGSYQPDIESVTLDPEDFEDESILSEEGVKQEEEESVTPRVIKVKVPKVPFNFEAIQREHASRSHLPINLNLPPISTPSSVSTENRKDLETLEDDASGKSRRKPTVARVGGNLQILANFTQYCPPSHARTLFWNWTKAGDTAVLQCPQGSTGFAKWPCDLGPPQPRWDENGPTFSECRSLWLADLDSRLREGVSTQNVSVILADKTDKEILFGGDIPLAARMLKHMSERMHYDIQRTIDPTKRESMVTDLVQNVVRVSSNLISDRNHQGWIDLGRDEAGQAATSLMVAVEENAFLLADSVTSEKIIIKPTENILLSIRVMQSRNVHRQRFPSVESIASWNNHGDSIELEADSLLQNGDNGAVRAVFATYNQLENILQPIAQRHIDANFFVNSKIISASLGRGRHIELSKPARITFKHLNEIEDIARMKSKCVYWDYLSNHWSEDGCRLVDGNSTHTICSCNHLTNFALLMSHQPTGNSPTANSIASENDGSLEPLPSQERPSETSNPISKHVSTIVASVATLISAAVIVFFAVMAWRRFRVSHQCRAALEKSGLPCFHKTKDMADKDKGNKGNFYTVTPKLNLTSLNVNNRANGTGTNNDETPELMEAQQFFEHMISLQKNQENLVQNKGRRSSSATGLGEGDTPSGGATAANIEDKPNNIEQQSIMILNNMRKSKMNNSHKKTGSNSGPSNEPMYQKHSNYARALSPYNHIYMEIDGITDGAEGCPVYEPLNHSETYMMSTVSDMSEDNGNYNMTGLNYNSDVSRQSSSRESRPLIRPNSVHEHRNLLQTISGVLHSQSVRLAPTSGNQNGIRGCATLHPVRRIVNSHGSSSAAIFENNGRNTIARLGGQHAARMLQGERHMFESVPLQVTTMNGNQFVRLDFTEEMQQQQQMATSDFGAGGTLPNGRPGQIHAPVHSQRIISSSNLPIPQFARPFSEN